MDQTATATPKDLAGAVLSIDLSAVQKNWRYLNSHAGSAECGAAVKGNAYGLGVEPVGRALWEAGCRSFFVARPKEGEELRGVLPEATIYVLDGLFPGQAEFYAQNNLLPALISTEEAREWAAFGQGLWPETSLRHSCRYGHQPPGLSHPRIHRLAGRDRDDGRPQRQPAHEPSRLRRRSHAIPSP